MDGVNQISYFFEYNFIDSIYMLQLLNKQL